MPIFWADLHNHNNIGYGKGSIERAYTIARSTLDVYAFTPHGWWSDLPTHDSKITTYHLEGFNRVDENWNEVLAFAQRMYQPGEFVTIPAYEWHSNTWGDYCILNPNSDARLIRSENIEDLKQACRQTRALMIPHHCAYPKGKRGTAWPSIDTVISPVAEVFSEHGNSLEPKSPFGMHNHSMGGVQTSQTIITQIRDGLIIGFTAGTDNHYGHPGSYGEGLTALVMEELTREQVFEALRSRHTYATTGEKIEIVLLTDSGKTMGDILPVGQIPEISIHLKCQDELDHVELLLDGIGVDKRSQTICTKQPPVTSNFTKTWFMRVELGWSGMDDSSVANWEFDLNLRHGKVKSYHTYFSSGPKTFEMLDHVERNLEGGIHMNVHTSRSNSIPTQMVLLEIEGSQSTVIEYKIHCTLHNTEFVRQGYLEAKQVIEDDAYIFLDESYAVPKVKIHQLIPEEALAHHFVWDAATIATLLDMLPCGNSHRSIFFKIVQKNGHCAWTSPIILNL
jgi:hypothetical protein